MRELNLLSFIFQAAAAIACFYGGFIPAGIIFLFATAFSFLTMIESYKNPGFEIQKDMIKRAKQLESLNNKIHLVDKVIEYFIQDKNYTTTRLVAMKDYKPNSWSKRILHSFSVSMAEKHLNGCIKDIKKFTDKKEKLHLEMDELMYRR